MVCSAGSVRCTSVVCTWASRSPPDPGKAAGLGGHALSPPSGGGREETGEEEE